MGVAVKKSSKFMFTWMVALGCCLCTIPAVHAEGLVLRYTRDAKDTPSPQPAAQIEVLVLQGSNGPGGIAPELRNLPQLARPPFSAYSQITLVSRTTLPLGPTARSISLPNGNSASVASQGRLPNGRYEVTVQLTIEGRTHNIQFSASPGDPFFTARSTGTNSALILGFIVR